MKIGVYVINLDRSTHRWETMREAARQHRIELIRIAGIDGHRLPAADFVDIDWARFRRHAGRRMLPGEYGCYRSHLKCLAALASSDFDAAIIMEDDIEIAEDTLARTAAAFQAMPDADVLKLFNHRCRGFLKASGTEFGDEVGRCLHGPQGSAACYALTRSAAGRMLMRLREMAFPFDVALERGWGYGFSVFTLRKNLVTLTKCSGESQIGHRIDYRQMKYRGIRRLPTYAARTIEYCWRVKYAPLPWISHFVLASRKRALIDSRA